MSYVYTLTFVTETCYKCGIAFGLESNYQKELLRSHNSFYCPNGHSQHYIGESEADKLKRQLAAKQDYIESLRKQRDATERSLNATKGHLTRIKKRVGNGSCPCCMRHFENLQKHMQTKHPEYSKGND